MSARSFLPPGAYADVPNLRDALGLPQRTGPSAIDTPPLFVTDDRATTRTVVAFQGHRFRVVVTPVEAEGRRKIAAVVPEGVERAIARTVTVRHALRKNATPMLR